MEAASTETTRFCPMCAAPLRPRAVFCHRCGKPFPEESAVVYQANKSAASETHSLNAREVKDSNNNHPAAELKADVKNQSAKTETISKNENAAALNETVSEIEKNAEKPPRVKHRVVQTTEYVWEESAADPTWRFAAATVVILIFVLLILWFGNFIHF